MADSDEIGRRPGGDGIDHCAILTDTILVPQDYGDVNCDTLDHQQQETLLARGHQNTPSFAQTEAASLSMYGSGQSTPLSATVEDLLERYTRRGTKTKYECIQRKWIEYCREKWQDCMAASTALFLNFIGDEFDRG